MSILSTAISGLTGGLSTKIIIYAVITLLCAGGVGATYLSITHNAKKTQELTDEFKDMKSVISQQQTALKNAQEMLDLNNKSVEDLNSNVNTIHQKFESLNDYLTSAATASKDKPASEILKKTLENLSKDLK